MTPAQKSTLYALVALWTGLIVWDIFLATDGQAGTTISAVMKEISHFVVISYIFGVLAGHLFWNKKGRSTEEDRKWHRTKFLIACAIGGVLVVWQLVSNDPAITFLANNQIAPFAFIGIPCGHLLWPQFSGEPGA